MNTDILNTILITKYDADSFIQRIVSAQEKVFNIKKTPQQIIKDEFSPEEIQLLNILAKQEKTEIEKKDEFLNLLKKAQEKLTKLTTIRLILAFDPSQSFIKRLSAVINHDSPDYRLLEFEKDTSIMGGVIMEISGKRIDRSLHRKFEII